MGQVNEKFEAEKQSLKKNVTQALFGRKKALKKIFYQFLPQISSMYSFRNINSPFQLFKHFSRMMIMIFLNIIIWYLKIGKKYSGLNFW